MTGGLGRGGKVRRSVPEFGFCFLLRSVYVGSNFLSIFFVVIGQHIRICHAQHFQPVHASHFLFVGEIGITKFLEPVEVIERGVINAIRAG